MTTLASILTMIGISILGSFLYSVINAKRHFKPKMFNHRIFLRENKYTWLYSFLICTIIAIIVNVIPDSAGAIESATGLAISSEIASFLTLGFALCASMEKDKLTSLEKENILNKNSEL
tara:strand:- start:855 stop:1211 length:357 start_codon:yes stop_codon:yes gene_type:complete